MVGGRVVSLTRPLPPKRWMYCMTVRVLVIQYIQCCRGSGLVNETRGRDEGERNEGRFITVLHIMSAIVDVRGFLGTF